MILRSKFEGKKYLIKLTAMFAIPDNQKIVLLNLFGILEEVFAQAQTTTRRSVTTRDVSIWSECLWTTKN